MTVSAAPREYVITYGGYTVGGEIGSGADLHGYPVLEQSRDRGIVSFDVLITSDTEGAFAAATEKLEEAFRKPYQRLKVTLNSTTLIDASQTGNTGLDAIATVTLPGGPPDSARSRRYRIRIEYGINAKWATTRGLRDSSVIVRKTPAGRREVTLRGTFTALPGSADAKAVHDGAIDAWAAAQLTWLGISTYELVQERDLRISINRKTADFERVYRELIFEQAGSSNDSAIVEQSLVVTRSARGSEYSPTTDGGSGSTGTTVAAAPLMDVSASYSAWIDEDVTTDLPAKWDSIKSWVIQQIRDVAGGQFALMRIAPSFDHDENRILARVEGLVPNQDGGTLLQNIVETVMQRDPGYEFVPVWDGDPESAHVFQGSQVRLETVTRRFRELSGGSGGASPSINSWVRGAQALGAAAAPAAAAPAVQAGKQGFIVSETSGTRPLVVGVGADQIAFNERWKSTTTRYVTAV